MPSPKPGTKDSFDIFAPGASLWTALFWKPLPTGTSSGTLAPTCSTPLAGSSAIPDTSWKGEPESGSACPTASGVEANRGEMSFGPNWLSNFRSGRKSFAGVDLSQYAQYASLAERTFS